MCEGPSIVEVYLRPLAPRGLETLRVCVDPSGGSSGESGGLGGDANSGHLLTSAREATLIYGLVEKEGLKEMRREPYGSSTLRR